MKGQTSQLEEIAINEAVEKRYRINSPKSIGLFFASPFIGLAYVVAAPVYGMYKLGEVAIEAYRSR